MYIVPYNYVRNAADRSIPWNLTEDQFFTLTQQDCQYCGIAPSSIRKTDGTEFIWNGVDRVNNLLGYQPDNVVPCCKVCNSAKNTMTLKAFKAWVTRVYEHLS